MAADNDNRPVRETSRRLTLAGRVERDGRVTFTRSDEGQTSDSKAVAPGFPNDPREA